MAITVTSGEEAVKGIAYQFVVEEIDTLLAICKMFHKCGCKQEVKLIAEAIAILYDVRASEKS
jgi:hypothetical protein